MALIECNQCGNEVSEDAEACPQCGHPIKPKTSDFTGCLAFFFALIVAVFVIDLLPSNDSEITEIDSVMGEYASNPFEEPNETPPEDSFIDFAPNPFSNPQDVKRATGDNTNKRELVNVSSSVFNWQELDFTIAINSSGNACSKVTYKKLSHESKGERFISVLCADGGSFMVYLPNKITDKVRVLPCDIQEATTGVKCFDKF